ncbi:MAG: uroporphyrinogen decarboxylase [Rhodospirillaceae bacterium]|jgi:uroporphyrinogen decarboxylase|nr:uroporphyrinogen decarboxylase [Rhodospirillaceae bacterium]
MKALLAVLHGHILTPPPIWLMRQAGRFLPEYRALRQQSPDLMALFLNPTKAAEITLQPLQRFALDAAIIFADILLVPYGLGLKVGFGDQHGLGQTGVASTAAELEGLRYDQAAAMQRWQPVAEVVRMVKKDLPEQATLLGFAGAPWTIAYYLQRQQNLPITVGSGLMDLLITATIDYLCLQIAAGVEAVQLFDSWAGLALDDYQRLVIEPHQRVIAGVRARYPTIPIIGFPKGSGDAYADYAAAVPVSALGLDHEVELARLLPLLPPQLPLQGNLAPELLQRGGDEMAKAIYQLQHLMIGRPHIMNLGHGVLPDTDPAHVAQLIDLVKTPQSAMVSS